MTNITRYLAGRVIKVVGNALKVICYFFHVLFPEKRFVIPHHSDAFIKISSGHVIPKTIWQTNYTDKVTIAVYLNYLFNRAMSPTYEYRFMDDTECADFVKNCYSSKIATNYFKLQIGAARADFWRILALQKFGGVYLDIDAHVVWPLGFIIKPELKELYLRHKNNALTNYFLASANNNPHLDSIINSIMENISKATSNNVFELTGPGALNRAVDKDRLKTLDYRYTCYQGTFTNKYFQYLDHPLGRWTSVQEVSDIIKN